MKRNDFLSECGEAATAISHSSFTRNAISDQQKNPPPEGFLFVRTYRFRSSSRSPKNRAISSSMGSVSS